jgi:hypothetical protein
MKQSVVVTALILPVALVGLWVAASWFPLGVTEDGSEQYLALAESMRDGTFFYPVRTGMDGYNLIVRTIGYPIILLFAKWLEGVSGLQQAILFMHFVIGALTLGAVFLTFPRARSLPWSAVVLAGFVAIMGGHALVVMPEWFAMNFQIWIALLLYRAISNRDDGALFGAYVLSALLTVTRPEFVVWLCLMGVAVGWWGRSQPFRVAGRLVLGLSPVFVWCALNYARFGIGTLSPLGVYSLYGLSIGLTSAAPALHSPAELAEVSRSLARVFPKELLVPFALDDRTGVELIAILNDNFKLVGYQLEKEYGLDWVRTYYQMKSAAFLGIQAAPMRYLGYLFFSLTAFFLFQWLLTCSLLVILAGCFFFKRTRELGKVISLFWLLHVCRGILVVATTVPCSRYAVVTLAPLTFLSVLLLVLSRSDSDQNCAKDLNRV